MAQKARLNYTAAEKALFLDLLKQKKDIVESKKTDGVTQAVKERAWTEITTDFNASSIVQKERTLPQLKKWWANIKQVQRDIKTTQRQNAFATGGGPPKEVKDLDPQVEAIAPDLMQPAPCVFSSNNSADNSGKASEIIFSGHLDELNQILGTGISAEVEDALSENINIDPELPTETLVEENVIAPCPENNTHLGAKRTKQDEVCFSKKLKSDRLDPRIELSMQHMKEIHQLKMQQMKLEFERKEAHARRIEEIEVQVFKAKLENEKEI